MKLNTKRTGSIGELGVISNLIRHGYDVYIPQVDDKGVDLVVDTRYGLKKVQVKTIGSTRNTTAIEIRLFKYIDKGIDVAAIYYFPKNIIAYYPYHNEKVITLALSVAKNKQEKRRDWFYKYEDFPYPL